MEKIKIFKDDFREKKICELQSIIDILKSEMDLYKENLNISPEMVDRHLNKITEISSSLNKYGKDIKENIHNPELDKIIGVHVFQLKDILTNINVDELSIKDKIFLIENLNIGESRLEASYNPYSYFSEDYKYACLLLILKSIKRNGKKGDRRYSVSDDILDSFEEYCYNRFDDFIEMYSFVKNKHDINTIANNKDMVIGCVGILEKFLDTIYSDIEEDDIKSPDLKLSFIGGIFQGVRFIGKID